MEDQVIYLVPPWWPFPEKESKRSSWTFEYWSTKVSLLTYSGEEELGGLSHEYGYEVNGVEGIVIFITIPGAVAVKKGFPSIEELVLELSECITIGNKKSKTPCIHYADIKDNKGNYRLVLFFPVGTTKKVYHGTITNIAVLLKDKYHELWQELLRQKEFLMGALDIREFHEIMNDWVSP